MQQFRLLAEQEKWEHYKRKQEKRELKTALVLQFNETFGESETDIKGWHEMCRVMGITPIPKTAYECKEVRPYQLFKYLELLNRVEYLSCFDAPMSTWWIL